MPIRVCERCAMVVDLPKRRLCSRCVEGKVNEYRNGWERLATAASEYNKADSDAEYKRAADNLKKSAIAYARGR